jgi:chloride channel protein, CIC family
VSARELVGFAFVGLVSGATAGLLPKAVIATREALNQALSDWGEREHVLRGVIGGLAVGALGLLSPESLGIGYSSIANWLAGGGNSGTAAVAFVAKFLGVTVALASSLVGGVFAPALFLGASLGAATGHLAHLLSPHAGIDPGAYALVGMGAFFAGFLRTPIASVLIVFELTGDYSLVAPLMLAVALSSLIAPKISPSTLVERQLEAGGIGSLESTSDPLSHRRVRDAMTTPVVSLDAGSTLLEAWAKAEQSGHRGFPVVDGQGLCTGIVDLESLEAAVRDGRWNEEVLNLMRSVPVLATPEEPLDRVFLRLGAARETRCPVVESLLHPKLIGFLAPSDFLRARVRASVEEGDTAFEPLGL